MKKVALLFALAFVACSSDSNDPKVAITVLNDVVQPVVPGDIITLSATTANIGSPTFTWSVLGETVAGATGAQVSIRITDQITEPTTLEITVTATGSNENNGTAKATATVKFQAQPGTRTNAAPVAVADTYAIGANGTLTASVSVLANDVDDAFFGTLLRAVIVDTTAHGLLVLNSNGTFSYKPATDYVGTDTFRYRATDGLLASDPATVTITVTDTNAAPVAVADDYTVAGNTVLSATRSVLANDTDDNFGGTTLQATLVDDVSHGTLMLSPNGTFTYTPDNDNFETATFTYVATDGTLTSDLATVTIEITQVNAAPVAKADEASVGKNGSLSVTLAQSILLNDEDDGFPGTSALTAVLDANVTHGTLALNANGSFTYSPAHDYVGLDTFTYHAFDGDRSSSVVAVNITVNDANQPPTAVADSYSVAQNTTLTASVSVLANDNDDDFSESGLLTAVIGTTTTHGTLTLNTDGTFTYVPNASYEGPDSFTYTAKDDGNLSSAAVTVTITVTHVNQPPVAVNDTGDVTKKVALTVAAPGVLANDTDDLNATLTAVLVTGPTHGTLTLNANGGYVYTPLGAYVGSDSFTYKASDGSLQSATAATVTLTVTNNAPVATADTYTTAPDGTLTVAAPGVLANDTDANGDALIVGVVTGPSHGTLTLLTDGSFTFASSAGYAGADSFVYRATDGTTFSAPVTVSLTVLGN